MRVTRASAASRSDNGRAAISDFSPVIPAKAGTQKVADAVGMPASAITRFCQNQDLQDWRDFQDFAFARLAVFAITEIPVKTNSDERLTVEDAPAES